MFKRSPTLRSDTLVSTVMGVPALALCCADVAGGTRATPGPPFGRPTGSLEGTGSVGLRSAKRRLASWKEMPSLVFMLFICFSLLYFSHVRDQAACSSRQLGHLCFAALQDSES